MISARGSPREFETGFHRFRAAVADEDPRQSGQRCQAFTDLPLERVEEQVRGVQECLRLIGNGPGQPLVRMTERGDADARQQVKVLPALRVVEAHTFSAHEGERCPAVCLQDVAGFAGLNLFEP